MSRSRAPRSSSRGAVFEDPHTLRLADGKKVTAKYVLIATGGRPNHGAAIPGIEHVISSDEAFHLSDLPKRVVVQGGGYIALEFACIFAGYGSDVTLVYRGENILRGFDDDVRAHVRKEMEKRGINVITGCTIDRIEKHGKEFTTHLSSGSSLASDQVMFAIGRHPNVANLGLEKAGVAINPKNGGIATDNWAKTSVPHIYAIGDVTHRVNLTPVAIREGHAFADTVFGKRPVEVDHTSIPTAVFSQPEVGTVGLSEADARAKYSHVDIYKADFKPIKATMSGRDTRVLMKLVVDGTTDRVLGCHIVGDAAAEIIQAVAIAVKMKATKADFDATMALHPTAAEELVTMRTPTRASRAAGGGVGRAIGRSKRRKLDGRRRSRRRGRSPRRYFDDRSPARTSCRGFRALPEDHCVFQMGHRRRLPRCCSP